jgi:FkbM family methyltransferase
VRRLAVLFRGILPPVTHPILRMAAVAAGVLPPGVVRALYRLGPLTEGLRRLLNRAAPKGAAVVTVAGGRLAGWRMRLNLQSEKDLWLGTYEPELQAAVADAVRPGMIVYDLGANVGYVSLLTARRLGTHGRILAFEPLPANLERLRENVQLNSLRDQVQVIPLAVAARTGRARFLVHASGGMGKVEGSAGRNGAYTEAIEVETVRLDDFVFGRGNPAPDLIKMDMEGGEVLAFPGMRRVLRRVRPLLLLELHGPEAGRVAWQALAAADYSVCEMARGYPPIEAAEALGWKAYVLGIPRESGKR